jgi:hypothetical protein
MLNYTWLCIRPETGSARTVRTVDSNTVHKVANSTYNSILYKQYIIHTVRTYGPYIGEGEGGPGQLRLAKSAPLGRILCVGG